MANLDATKRCEHGSIRGRCPYTEDRCRISYGSKRGPGPAKAARLNWLRSEILNRIDAGEHPTWEEVRDAYSLRFADEGSENRATEITDVIVELEEEGRVTFDGDVDAFRPRFSDDPSAVSPTVIAEVISGLVWPNPNTKGGHRKINAHLWRGDLADRRYRHCDVARAVWYLRDQSMLSCKNAGTGNWRWVGPTLEQHYDAEERDGHLTLVERKIEKQLVAQYLDWLGYQVRPLPCGESNEKEADLWDPSRGLLIEAKAHADGRTVAHAYGQVAWYRFLTDKPVSQTAVLLPERPARSEVAFLAQAGVGLIYPAGDGFVEDLRV